MCVSDLTSAAQPRQAIAPSQSVQALEPSSHLQLTCGYHVQHVPQGADSQHLTITVHVLSTAHTCGHHAQHGPMWLVHGAPRVDADSVGQAPPLNALVQRQALVHCGPPYL